MSGSRSMIAVVVLMPAVIALALWAFIWPNARLEPRDLPLGVAGSAQATAPVKAKLAERDGAFDVHTYADEAAARTAIEEREVYGAVVATPQGPELLTASAAGPAVAQLLTEAIREQAGQGRTVPVTDVVPTPADDPRGTTLSSSVLPMALAGIAVGGTATMLGMRGVRAGVAVVGAAAVIGLVAAGITHSWLGTMTGDWWAVAGAFGLTTLAGGAAITGLGALLGSVGTGLGAVLMMFLGNPFSGVSSAPELLPEPVGFIGGLLPPGAGGSLLRSVAYFDGNGAAGPVVTLTIWALAGIVLIALGELVHRRRAATGRPEDAGQRTPAAA